MYKKRDTHKGNSQGPFRKSDPSLLARAALLGLSTLLGAACSRHRAPGPAETESPAPEAETGVAPLEVAARSAESNGTPTSGASASGAAQRGAGTVVSASAEPSAAGSAAPPACPRYGAPERLATISDAALGEISGIVPASQPGSFWVHNDSGDGPHAYLVTSAGKRAATFTFGGGRAVDVEDMARGPRAPSGTYLYLADIGDNLAERRDGVTILRAREPDVGAPPQLPVETMRLTYPGGAMDAEAFLVDPRTGELVIVAKHPLLPARVLVAKQFLPMAEMLDLGAITADSSGQVIAFVTGAAVSDDGRFALLRTYEAAYLFTRRSAQTLGQALLGPACRIETAPEKQGEAISFAPAQPGARAGSPPPLVTVSEGSPTTIWLQTPE